MLRFSAVTLFPEMFSAIRNEGVIARAISEKKIDIETVFLREFGMTDRRNVDDRPFGGGDGMLIRPDVLDNALQSCVRPESFVIHLTPAGQVFSSSFAKQLVQKKHLVLLCGRYGGFDDRVLQKWTHAHVSMGDFVLSGGELPAMAVIDAVARFVPGVLGNSDSANCDSFEDGLLEPPSFTKPLEFNGQAVPSVLLSGDHQKIAKYRRLEQLTRTAERRPDLIHALWSTLSKSEQTLVLRVWKQGK